MSGLILWTPEAKAAIRNVVDALKKSGHTYINSHNNTPIKLDDNSLLVCQYQEKTGKDEWKIYTMNSYCKFRYMYGCVKKYNKHDATFQEEEKKLNWTRIEAKENTWITPFGDVSSCNPLVAHRTGSVWMTQDAKGIIFHSYMLEGGSTVISDRGNNQRQVIQKVTFSELETLLN